MTGNEEAAIVNSPRWENLAVLLAGFEQRGVLYDLLEGVFRYCDVNGVLTPNEETGIDVCRAGLTEYLWRQRGLCVTCAGTPKEATRPDCGPKLRQTNPPLYCACCWQAGKWKEGI